MPRKTKQTKPAIPSRLRFQLTGQHSLKDFRDMLLEAINQLETFGVTHCGGSDLYVLPTNKDGVAFTKLGFEKKRIDEKIVIENPYRTIADEHGI